MPSPGNKTSEAYKCSVMHSAPFRALYQSSAGQEKIMGDKIRITETEETPVAPGVKLVRDVTEEAPVKTEVVEKKVTVEKETVSDD